MKTEEVAKKVVELTRKQAWREALDTLYAKDIVGVEAWGMEGESPEKRRLKADTDRQQIAFVRESGRDDSPSRPLSRRTFRRNVPT